MKPTTTALVPAISALVTRDDAEFLYETLSAILPMVVNARRPVGLVGDAGVLAPLLDLAATDKEAFTKAMHLVDEKRVLRGLTPLLPQETAAFKKNPYMKEFMAQKRQREKRAAEIENLSRSERDQLRGPARMEFCRLQSAKWKARLDAIVVKIRSANGGTAPKEALELARDQFWATVDQELDSAEATARKKPGKP